MAQKRIDYDKFGHCVKCHTNLIIEKVVQDDSGRLTIQRMWKPEKDETQFLLDDGSKMRVTICKQCKEKLTEADNREIMDSVIRGWQKEIERIQHWSIEKKVAYLDRYSKRKIVCNSENKKDDLLRKQLDKWHKAKLKKAVKGAKHGNN